MAISNPYWNATASRPSKPATIQRGTINFDGKTDQEALQAAVDEWSQPPRRDGEFPTVQHIDKGNVFWYKDWLGVPQMLLNENNQAVISGTEHVAKQIIRALSHASEK